MENHDNRRLTPETDPLASGLRAIIPSERLEFALQDMLPENLKGVLGDIAESEGRTVGSLVIEGLARTIDEHSEDPIRALQLGGLEEKQSQVPEFNLPLTTSAAAALIGVSRPTFIKMLNKGELPFHQVGRDRRIMQNDVRAFVDRRRHEALQRTTTVE